jgi:hypothetical protein
VISGHVEKRNVQPADEILQVVEGEVAAADDDVRPDRREPVPVEAVFDLVADGEDAQLVVRPF